MRALLLIALAASAGCQCQGAGQPPTVRIVAPGDWTYLDGPGPHELRGEVTDPDELIQPDRVTWRSDRDGQLGKGAITSATLSAGEHRLSLEAVDREGNLGSAQVSVFVRLTDVPPTDGGARVDGGLAPDGGAGADGGTDTAPVVTITAPNGGAFIDEGTPLTFSGSALDAEDGPLTGGALVWTGDRLGLIGTGSPVTLTNAALGVHQVVLTATDRSGRSSFAAVTFTVVRPGSNRPPTVTIAAPSSGGQFLVGTPIALQGSATDPEDGAITGMRLTWTSNLAGNLAAGELASVTMSQGVHVVTLTAIDSMGATGSASVTISVNQPNNQPPTATITSPTTSQTHFEGTQLTFTGTGTDPEDGALASGALRWSSNLDGQLGAGSPFVISSLSRGDHTITLTVTDSGGNTGIATVPVRILPRNAAPMVAITAPVSGHTVSAGTPIGFSGTATDLEDGPLSGASVRWSSSLDGPLGTGLTLTTGALSVGAHTITLTAIDSGGRSASASITVTVTMSAMNVPPLARLTGPSTGQATDPLTFDGSSSTDADGTIVSYRFDFGDGTPAVTSAMPTATHAFSTAGSYTVTLTVTDDRGATASTTLVVSVSAFVRVPVIVSATGEDVGTACTLATPGSRVFLAWTSSRHPGLYFAERVGGVLQAEVVDALGFNTGGVIGQYVSMQVEANGTPHLVYLRNDTVMYATKSAGAWVRERVDGPGAVALAGVSAESAPSLALSGTSPVVLYTADLGAFYRAAISTRTGPGTWTRSVVAPVAATSSSVYSYGELAIDSSGRHLFAALDFTAASSAARHQLVAWTASTRSSVTLPQPLSARTSLALASPSRLLMLGGFGVLDASLATPFASTTMTRSLVETFATNQHALAVDSAGLPRLVVRHGGSLEAVRSTGPGFWEWLDLGPADNGLIDVSVDGANDTRACFVRAGKLMLY